MQLCAQTRQLQKQDGIMTDSNLGTQKESEIKISNIGQQKINTLNKCTLGDVGAVEPNLTKCQCKGLEKCIVIL